MERKLPLKETIALGFFMFALFLGAGNIIFPPLLGQQAGESLLSAIIGFLVTGVGLPLLAVFTIARSGGDLNDLSNRVHPGFAKVFPVIIYLTIGPFFGIPRTGTVTYEIGIAPFLSNESSMGLFISTFVFFLITFWLALNPAKLVDRVGKVLTPLLLLLIVVISIRGFASPIGSFGEVAGKYRDGAFFGGFVEGYLTMDAIAALVFGVVVIHRVKEMGIKTAAAIRSYTIKAGIIAGIGLSFVYVSLSFIGATSVEGVGIQENGGEILSSVTSLLFGSIGSIILALVITGACLTTSVGLVSACAEYLSQRFAKLSYPVVVTFLCLFSFTMANLGLSQLISVSIPLLISIYPIAIVLILLSLVHSYIPVFRAVYIGAIIGAGIVSIYDGLTTAGIEAASISTALTFVPLYTNGLGWLFPSIVGGLIGLLFQYVRLLNGAASSK
ncbi:branched-chain amino acid transport system II carrier protein [Neobacillus sp. DY30]|uniref:branched-chain amino acid transport system II carrier protein n=1 Tax=Neobacillus sp. DY30 TaxID=3047871 RepID=UPI0024BFDAF0|nr:branched-chain amino acid transport system II carrier protein [Neobacillus sp. DY30]WHY01249.1 branched-chain amino acid transport system II carrier protein [Neobacillus sp. DY30]